MMSRGTHARIPLISQQVSEEILQTEFLIFLVQTFLFNLSLSHHHRRSRLSFER